MDHQTMHLVLEALGSDSDADNIAGFGILHDILEKQRKRRIILLCLIALLNARDAKPSTYLG